MKNIAIICGGYSGEYQISIESATTVEEKIDKTKYNPYVVIIDKSKWYYVDKEGAEHIVNRDDFTLLLGNKLIKFDGVFNVIHGTPGEDGKLLAFFDTIGMPYTSCDTDTSALTFNKYYCNLVVAALGVNVAKSYSFIEGETIPKETIVNDLGLPVFVKPARSGSSVGVSKVKTLDDFDAAIEEAFKTDKRVIIEQFLDGREFGCGLYTHNNMMKVLPITEIISKKDFFDYEAKYSGSMSDEITPPQNLDKEAETDIKAISAMLYRKLNCKGVIRLDFMLTRTDLFLIEINTVPGMSANSIVPQQAEVMGVSLEELFTDVVEGMFN